MKRIRVGIIGQGRSGRNIHRYLIDTNKDIHEMFELVGVADPIAERRQYPDAISVSPDFKEYDNYKDMLKDKSIDLIVNATRSMDHIPVSIEAMEAGFNVLCEKPLARTVADVDKVIEVSKRTGKFFAVFQQSRFRHLFRKTLDIMNSGILGDIIMVKISYAGFKRRWDWQTIQDMCAGELLNTGPHPLDQAVIFYGDADPERIFCQMACAKTFGDAEDHVKLILAGKGHPTIDLEVSNCNMYPGANYEVYGTLGGLTAKGTELKWRYCIPEELPKQQLVKEPLRGAGNMPIYCSEKVAYYEESCTLPEATLGMDAWGGKYYKQLYAALTDGTPMEVTLEQVRRQIMIIEECHKQNPLPKKVTL